MDNDFKTASVWNEPQSWIRSAAPARLYAAVSFCILSLFAVIVLIRCAVGEFSSTISPVGFAVCILLASIWVASLKVAAEWPPYRLTSEVSLIAGILIGLPLDAIAIALLSSSWTYFGAALTLGWLSLVGWFCISTSSVEGMRWLFGQLIWQEVVQFLCPEPQHPRHEQPPAPPSESTFFKGLPRESLLALAREPVQNEPLEDDADNDEGDGKLLSRLQRRALESGADLLEGQLFAKFVRGAKQAILHVPFSPPFLTAPRVDCEVRDGAEVRVKISAIFNYGVRVELKRNSVDLPEMEVAIDLYAESPPSDAPATMTL